MLSIGDKYTGTLVLSICVIILDREYQVFLRKKSPYFMFGPISSCDTNSAEHRIQQQISHNKLKVFEEVRYVAIYSSIKLYVKPAPFKCLPAILALTFRETHNVYSASYNPQQR